MDLEYDDWMEMVLHTDNFLEYFKQHWDADIVTHSYRSVLFKASIDINAIMDESVNSIAQWLVEQDMLEQVISFSFNVKLIAGEKSILDLQTIRKSAQDKASKTERPRKAAPQNSSTFRNTS